MQLLLKKTSVGILFSFMAITSCKKEGKAPVINSIEGGKEKIAVGQYMELIPNISDGDTKEEKLNYIWAGTDGTSGKGKTLKWRPLKSGNQTLTLTVSDGDKLTEKTISFNVQAADFRLGLWGNTSTEIQLYETKAGKTSLSKTTTSIVYVGENDDILDMYGLEKGALNRAIKAYTTVYSNSNQYVTSYNSISNNLRAKYGSSLSSMIYFRTSEIHSRLTGKPELWADAIVAGDARLETIWEHGKNRISLKLVKSTSSDLIILGEYHEPKTITATTSSFESKTVQEIEELIGQINR